MAGGVAPTARPGRAGVHERVARRSQHVGASGPVLADDTYRMLDTAERLLQAFSAAEQLTRPGDEARTCSARCSTSRRGRERRKTAAKPTEGEPLKGLTPWREIITPHADVAIGPIRAGGVRRRPVSGRHAATPTRSTRTRSRSSAAPTSPNGLRELLVGRGAAAERRGGDPVVELQTNFGGGKTHSMIALYHLASGMPAARAPGRR